MTKVIVFVILRTRLRNVLKLNRSCTVDCVSLTSSEKNRSIKPSAVTCNSLARKGRLPLAYQFVVAVENILLESGAFYPQDFFLIGPICYLLVTTAGLAWLFHGCVPRKGIWVYNVACFLVSTSIVVEKLTFRDYLSEFQELRFVDTQHGNSTCLIWSLRKESALKLSVSFNRRFLSTLTQ